MSYCPNCGNAMRLGRERCYLCIEHLNRHGCERPVKRKRPIPVQEAPHPTVVNLHFCGQIIGEVETSDEDADEVYLARMDQAEARHVPIAAIVPVRREWRPQKQLRPWQGR